MTDTHCPYCALQCAQRLTGGGLGDEPVAAEPRSFPTNGNGMCQKGWTSAEVLRATDRITAPLRRTGDVFEEVSWDDALDEIASRVQALQAEHGHDAVAVFGGGGLTNEKAYQLGKFARIALRTKNIDYNGRFCMSSAAAAANRTLGIDRGLPFPLTDLNDADAILLLGSNLADTMPPAVQHLSGVRERGGLIVTDPRRSATARLTEEGAGEHLQLVPGTDLVVLLGLLHIVFAQDLAHEDYLAARVNGAVDVRRSVSEWWPARVAAHTGISETQLHRTANLLARASRGRGAFILTGRGAEQHTDGTDTVTAAINLALALGMPGAERGGYGAITGQGNGQGGREHGQKADQLPGYRMITDPAAREHVARVWGVDPAIIPGPGPAAVQLLDSLGTTGGPQALFVHGSNVIVSAPDATVVKRRLRSLGLLVVCDFVPSETALLADFILPVTQWAEEEGTMTGLEGRVLRRRRAVLPSPGVRSELEIWSALAARLDAPGTFSTDPREVFDELGRASAGGRADYSGITYDRLDAGEALYWPCPAQDGEPHPGTPRLFAETFPTADGRAKMIAVRPTGPADDLRAEAPIYLVTGRVLQHYQSGAQTRRVAKLNEAQPKAYVEIHPFLADRLGVEGTEDIRIASKRGTVVAAARISRDIRPDTVFMPFHFGDEGMVNAVTNAATDPISGMPEFKVCAVQIEKVPT
ncbi:molybdopterin oxidoreductase family protein [soil metagenome]